MGWKLEERTDWVQSFPDPSEVKSGDVFGMFKPSGSASMIMYGTGSRISHVEMALWFDDELYIVESNGLGIHRSTWD